MPVSHRVAGLALLLVAALLVGIPTPASAATTYFVDGDPGCNDATVDSSVTPYCTISAAVVDAIDGDTIAVAAGTYTNTVPSVVFLTENLTINGAGQGVTIIDAENARVGVGVSGTDVTLTDLTIRDGFFAGTGGNLLVSASSHIQLTDVTIDGGAAQSGGGIAVVNTSSADLLRVTVSNNSASAGIGSGGGGGIFLSTGSSLAVIDSAFTSNTSVGHGGAISALQSGNVTIDGSTFTTNSTTTGQGGAIVFHSSAATYSISTSTFSGNTAVIGGGAVATGDGANSITSSYFTLNTSTGYGGALFHEGTDNLVVTNTTFYDNDAGTDGGAVRGDGFFVNVTFSANTAGGNGGGLARSVGAPNVANSILYGNAAVGLGDDCYQMTSEGHNLIGILTDCVSGGDITGNLAGIDPLLGLPANNGGATLTMALTVNSPAYNAGNPDAPDPTDWDAAGDANTGDWSCDPTDQRGVARDNPRCDIGAFEFEEDITVGLVDPSQGKWYLRDGSGVVSSFFFGVPGDYTFAGDWDCDGVDTPGLYRQSDGFAYLRNTNTQGVADISFFLGNPGDIPIAGDFDGDGCDTLSVYRPSQGRVFITDTLGQNGGIFVAEYDYYFGNPGDKPFVGDFDGDGIDTIGLHRESTGLVYFRNTHTQGTADNQFFFGNPADCLVAGDWGIVDGIDTPAVFRPSNTTFYFRHTNTQGNADSQLTWGQTTWLPIAGNWGL